MSVEIRIGDCRELLRAIPDESVHCCVTSPPYFGLRDYGMAGQIGLETTPDAFVAEMVSVFSEVRRALRDDGVLWLNLGDSYSNAGTRQGDRDGAVTNFAQPHRMIGDGYRARVPGLKNKDLCGIPWRVAFALQADGWYLRQDIIWSKPNPMPESIRDRCTKAHEYLFLMAKAERYWFDQDAISEPVAASSIDRLAQNVEAQTGSYRVPGKTNGAMKAVSRKIPTADTKLSGSYSEGAGRNDGGGHRSGGFIHGQTRNRRSVWEVTTQPFSEAHFATFPPDLIEPCILAGCPKQCCAKCGAPWLRMTEREEVKLRPNSQSIRGNSASSNVSGSPQRGSMAVKSTTLGFKPSCDCNADVMPGTVLDPFGGAGTTGLVADRLGRNAILLELNPTYAAMARRRIEQDAGMFAEVAAR